MSTSESSPTFKGCRHLKATFTESRHPKATQKIVHQKSRSRTFFSRSRHLDIFFLGCRYLIALNLQLNVRSDGSFLVKFTLIMEESEGER